MPAGMWHPRSDTRRATLTTLLQQLRDAAAKTQNAAPDLQTVPMSSSQSEGSFKHPFPLSSIHDMAMQHAVNVWDLMLAFWGTTEQEDDNDGDVDHIRREVCCRRLNCVCPAHVWGRFFWFFSSRTPQTTQSTFCVFNNLQITNLIQMVSKRIRKIQKHMLLLHETEQKMFRC